MLESNFRAISHLKIGMTRKLPQPLLILFRVRVDLTSPSNFYSKDVYQSTLVLLCYIGDMQITILESALSMMLKYFYIFELEKVSKIIDP